MLVDHKLEEDLAFSLQQVPEIFHGCRRRQTPPHLEVGQASEQRLPGRRPPSRDLRDHDAKSLQLRRIRFRQVPLPIASDDQRRQFGRQLPLQGTFFLGHPARDVALVRRQPDPQRVRTHLFRGLEGCRRIAGLGQQHGGRRIRRGCIARNGMARAFERGVRHPSDREQRGACRTKRRLWAAKLALRPRLGHQRAPQHIVTGEGDAGPSRVHRLLQCPGMLPLARQRLSEADAGSGRRFLHVQNLERSQALAVPRNRLVVLLLGGQGKSEADLRAGDALVIGRTRAERDALGIGFFACAKASGDQFVERRALQHATGPPRVSGGLEMFP